MHRYIIPCFAEGMKNIFKVGEYHSVLILTVGYTNGQGDVSVVLQTKIQVVGF